VSAPAGVPAVEFESVSFAIGGHAILENVSFRLAAGQTTVLLGPSGIGKSTVLRLILGLALPQSGDVRVHGQSLLGSTDEQRDEIRKRIGMVFQNGALFDSLTVGENVVYGSLEHGGLPFRDAEPVARRYLAMVGLDPDFVLDRLPDELSVGMQRRAAIARALAFNEPRILLYDEPTTGLDPISVETITDVIIRLRQELGVTSLVVTHEIAHALKVANRFLFLYDRRIAFEGNAHELAETREPALVLFLEPFKISVATAFQSFSNGNGSA
jgi:phospholipid/cholesterol/gamma-HCH transport system ATP-binding protein